MTPRSRAGSPSPTRGSASRHAQSSSKLVTTLRYGENPHQNAALYVPNRPATIGLPQAQQVQGKELSYNNYNDANAALELVAEFAADKPTVVIVKHANPCGVATADTLLEAWQQALACDSASAFGGIVAVNQPLDGPTAKRSARSSPKWSSPWRRRGRKDAFARKKNLRLLLVNDLPDAHRAGLTLVPIAGGLLVQDRDNARWATTR
jgi:phosphoribosylaminoimidazolecarboxamide formyltransferase/IMP cyclohydrolase